jgi:hypothetical protein
MKKLFIAIALLVGSQYAAAQSKCQCPPTKSTPKDNWKSITVKKKYKIQQVSTGLLSSVNVTYYYIVGTDNKAYIVNRVEDWMICEVGGIMWTDNGESAQIKKRRYEFFGD